MSAMPAKKLEEFYEEESNKKEDQFLPIEPPFEPEDLADKEEWKNLEYIIKKQKEFVGKSFQSYSGDELRLDNSWFTQNMMNYTNHLAQKKKEYCDYFQEVVDPSKRKYEIKGYLGRGAWGIVLEAYDNVRHETVAIKLFAPNEIGANQAEVRNIDERSGIYKEAGSVYHTRNITPRFIDETQDGRPMIIMGKYNKFFSDILKERKRWAKGLVFPKTPENRLYDSGLTAKDVKRYALQIANGVREMHTRYEKAHCDLHADNIAVEDFFNAEEDNLLVNDLGTSTFLVQQYASVEDNRENLGWMYIRAPEFWFGEQSRDKTLDVESFGKHDLYSLGSLLDKMLTGEYTLEKELDEAFEQKGLEGCLNLHRFMQADNQTEFRAYLQKKHKEHKVPQWWSELIQSLVLQDFDNSKKERIDGEFAMKMVKEAVKKQEEYEDKWKWLKRIKESAKEAAVAGTVLLGMGLGLAGGCGAMRFSFPRAAMDAEYRLKSQVKLDAGYTFKAETTYPQIEFRPLVEHNQSSLEAEYAQHLKAYGDRTVVDIMVSNLYKSMLDQYQQGFMYSRITQRYLKMFPDNEKKILEDDFVTSDIFRGVLAGVFDAQQKEGVVDLENALVEFFGGPRTLLNIMEHNDSSQFTKYSNNGKFKIDANLPDMGANWVLMRWLAYNTNDPRLEKHIDKGNKRFIVEYGDAKYTTHPIEVKKIERFKPSYVSLPTHVQTSD